MIEQIIIENYKSMHSAKIPLKHLNVLIGQNGVGKSNFISFFELVKNMLDQNLGSYILGQGGIERFLYQGSKHSDYIKALIDFDNMNAFFFELKPAIGNKAFIEKSGDFFNGIVDDSKDYEKWHKYIYDLAVEESKINEIDTKRAFYIKERIQKFIVYHFHDTSKTSPMRSPCNIADNEYLRHDASNLAAYLYRLQVTEPKVFKLIEGSIKSVAPYFKGFRLQPDRITPEKITLEWNEMDSDMYLDAQSFSDGTIRFIALATVLLQPNLPDTIIIDEPELGLHPSAINKLSALIKRASKKTQVIVATQSVNLIDYFDPEDIVVVDRVENQTVFKRFTTEELAVWLEEYSMGEIWEKNIIGGRP